MTQSAGRTQKNILVQFFPPPAFLTMPAVGIDISDKTIKFLELGRKQGAYTLTSFGDVDLADGAVLAGEIKDEAKLVAGLCEVAERVRPVFVRASLPEQKAYFFTTEVPARATHAQIIQTLEFELEEHVPLSPDKAVVDYDRLGQENQESENVSVGVTAYPRSTVEAYTEAFRKAGFSPLSFEIEAHAIERAVVPAGELGTFMVVDLGETRTGISIVSRGMLAFTSTLDNAGADITSIFKEELSLEKRDIAHAKNTIGLVGTKEHPNFGRRLADVVNKLGEEMKRHQVYWETHTKKEGGDTQPIEEVILCGGNANMKGLPGYLERMLGVPVRRGNVWENVFSLREHVPQIPYEVSLSYATAIGLALRGSN